MIRPAQKNLISLRKAPAKPQPSLRKAPAKPQPSLRKASAKPRDEGPTQKFNKPLHRLQSPEMTSL